MLDKDQSVPLCGHFLTCCKFSQHGSDNPSPFSSKQQALMQSDLTYKIESDQQENSLFHFSTCTMHLLLFCTMTNKCTVISQIITLLHVSTLSCHPQTACNQYLYRTSIIILYNEPTNAHSYFTNYRTATCFDTVVSSSGSL